MFRDVVGAAASPSSALQCSIDKANKAGLFVFCVSSEMSWQFCNNTEELRFIASPKYSHMAIKVLSRAYAVFPLPLHIHSAVREAAKPALGYQRKPQILKCETESQGKTGVTQPRASGRRAFQIR